MWLAGDRHQKTSVVPTVSLHRIVIYTDQIKRWYCACLNLSHVFTQCASTCHMCSHSVLQPVIYVHTVCFNLSHVFTQCASTCQMCSHSVLQPVTCVHTVCFNLSDVFTQRASTCHMCSHSVCFNVSHVFTQCASTCQMCSHSVLQPVTCVHTVCLQDSILAFHEHGMQGRSFRNNEVTQEICDKSRIFRLLSCYR